MTTLFWHFLHDHRYFEERKRSDILEMKVKRMERELDDLRDLMKKLLGALEEHLGSDIDEDGTVGEPRAKQIRVKKTRDNKQVRSQLRNQKKK